MGIGGSAGKYGQNPAKASNPNLDMVLPQNPKESEFLAIIPACLVQKDMFIMCYSWGWCNFLQR